jgi:hypothetical protein
LPRNSRRVQTLTGMAVDLNTHRRWRVRRWIGAWALLAIVARGLIPAGFMPAAAVDGGVHFVVCPAALSLASGSHHHPDGLRTHTDVVCPFAQSAGTAPTPSLLSSAMLVAAQPTVLCALAQPFVPQSDLPRHHAPRGPPQLA